MSDPALETLVSKHRVAEQTIAALRGQFSLFGLFEHRDLPGRWDLLLAAPWLGTDRRSLLEIAPYLPRLTAEEGALTGGVFAFPPDDGLVRQINRRLDTEGQVQEISSPELWEADIIRGFVIASHKNPLPIQEYQAAAG